MPYFLFGFARSGTTILSMMVGAHPDIAVPLSVTGLWYRYAKKLGAYNQLATKDDLERFVGDLLKEERISLWDVTLSRDELLRDLHPGSFPAVMDRFNSLYAEAKGKKCWGNIDIQTLTDMHIAHGWFPDAKFVHIVRDGRDVAISHETIPFGSTNTWECADHWVRDLEGNMKMGAILGPSNYLVVRYEDLILKSESTLESLCAFLGVPYSDSMLHYYQMVGEKIPEDRRWMWPLIGKPPDQSVVGKWKSKMSASKRGVFERAAGPLLSRLGYPEVSESSRSIPVLALELWQFLAREKRFHRFGKKLGLGRRSKLERTWTGMERESHSNSGSD